MTVRDEARLTTSAGIDRVLSMPTDDALAICKTKKRDAREAEKASYALPPNGVHANDTPRGARYT